MPWFVLYTKPKSEKKVAETLTTMGFEVYCPIITEVRQWSDRKKKVQTPLFKSYVFINLEEKERQKVFEVYGVVKYLFWLGKPAIVRDSEIETIKEWLDDDSYEGVELRGISPGDQITISRGAFKDQEAVVKEIGKNRLRLILKSLGCTVNVKIKDVQP